MYCLFGKCIAGRKDKPEPAWQMYYRPEGEAETSWQMYHRPEG